MSKKKKKIYLDRLYTQLKLLIFFMFVIIIMAFVFNYAVGDILESKEKGEKIRAKVIDIHEQNNPLNNPYKEDRKIYSITVQYDYNGQEYTYETGTVPYRYVAINDRIDIYIMDYNPNDVVVYVHNSSILPYILIPFFSILLIVDLYSCISTIKQINLYKKAWNSFNTITAQYIDVEVKTMLGNAQYYIICESDQINGTKMIFKSHPYKEHYLKSTIEKSNMKHFTIYYNAKNVKQYVMDTNKIDKVMYR